MHDPIKPLRDRSLGTAEFRNAADAVCLKLVSDLQFLLKKRGVQPEKIVIVIILRSAMAFLPAAIRAFPSAPVAVAGLKRDEKTAIAHWYYENFPPIAKDSVILLLDPMLATGGSVEETVLKLKSLGADLRKTYFVGIIAAPEGVERLAKHIPRENMIFGAVDEGLDAKKFIVPGLGDFGDRYFGYGGS